MRYIKAICRQCKTVVKFDIGNIPYEDAMKKIGQIQAFECPGYHVYIAGIIDHYDFELVEKDS